MTNPQYCLSLNSQAMESKLLMGGGNIVDHTNEQQRALEQRRKEIAEQKVSLTILIEYWFLKCFACLFFCCCFLFVFSPAIGHKVFLMLEIIFIACLSLDMRKSWPKCRFLSVYTTKKAQQNVLNSLLYMYLQYHSRDNCKPISIHVWLTLATFARKKLGKKRKENSILQQNLMKQETHWWKQCHEMHNRRQTQKWIGLKKKGLIQFFFNGLGFVSETCFKTLRQFMIIYTWIGLFTNITVKI